MAGPEMGMGTRGLDGFAASEMKRGVVGMGRLRWRDISPHSVV
jgi:hypothetical protein